MGFWRRGSGLRPQNAGGALGTSSRGGGLGGKGVGTQGVVRGTFRDPPCSRSSKRLQANGVQVHSQNKLKDQGLGSKLPLVNILDPKVSTWETAFKTQLCTLKVLEELEPKIE